MSVAGCLGSTEGQVYFRADRGSVDISDPCIDVAHGAKSAVYITGINRRREAVHHSVGNIDGLFKRIAGNHTHDRPENFFLRDPHLRVYIAVDGWLEEPAMRVVGIGQALAAQFKLRAFLAANLRIFLGSLDLLLVDLRTHLHGLIKAASNFKTFCPRYKLAYELLVNAFLHNHPAGGGATLPGGSESAPEHAIQRKIEVGIVENDDGVLSAHFERARLKHACGGLPYNAADFARSCKRYSPNIFMLHDGRACFGTKPGHDIDHTLGQAGFYQGVHEIDRGKRRIFRRFNHASVAAHQGGKELPGRNGHREIPGRDHPADADGHTDGHRELVRQLRRHGCAKQTASFTC